MAPESETNLSATKDPLSADVEGLEAEGNALFAAGSFIQAVKKYDAAIERAPDNAILRANRAACYIALKKYQEAIADATKATEIDAEYAKGWGRLGTAQEALENISAARQAYAHAIACLAVPLSEVNQRLKKQYEHCLRVVSDNPSRHIVMPQGTRFPWELARELPPQPPSSSAWVIIEANKEFEDGIKVIKSLCMSGATAIGMTGGLDDRCFHLKDQNFMELYKKYVSFEVQRRRARTDTRAPVELIGLAKERLALSGWDYVRPALSVTIRAWIMRGFIGNVLGGSIEETHAWYERVVTALGLGSQRVATCRHIESRCDFWAHVSARRAWSAYQYVYGGSGDNPRKNLPFSPARLLEMADAMLLELEQGMSEATVTPSPGFNSAFYVYPRGTALAMKGFYHFQMAKRGSTSEEESTSHIRDSADYYLQAAEVYAEDDETHALMLQQALAYFFMCGTSARETLALMARIRLAVPKMRRIWENSNNAAEGAHAKLNLTLKAEENMHDDLAHEKFALDDKIMLKPEP